MFNIKKNDNIFILEIKEFYESQKNIMLKYKDSLKNLSDFEKIDKYLFQIIEEIWEVRNAPNLSMEIEEICDVVMYLTSTVALIEDCFNNNGNLLINKESITSLTITKDEFSLDYLLSGVMNIRRLFPERKWHKTDKREKDPTRISTVLKILQELIRYTMSYLAGVDPSEYHGVSPFSYIQEKEKLLLK